MTIRRIIGSALLAAAAFTAGAQGYVDQQAVEPLLESQIGPASTVRPVTWHSYEIGKTKGGQKQVLAALKAHLDSLPGERRDQRLAIVELSNRVTTKYLMQRRQLLIPDEFPDDFRAYSPYPLRFDGAAGQSKVFIVDKYTQTFAAYENGELKRWGLVCSGREDDLTPTGRFNFNWRQEYRESSEAPPGEVWKMRWVFNFYAPAGIHVHQYQLPIATPSSHGCVRLTEADARWNYYWAAAAREVKNSPDQEATTVIVLNYTPAGFAAHWSESGSSLVLLPASVADVPAGPAGAQGVVQR